VTTPWEDIGYQPHRQPKRGGAALGGDSGAPPSNRAPDSCTVSRFQVLSMHVDSLELSYRGTLRDGVAARLTQLRELARNPSPHEQSKAQFIVGDEILMVRDKGAHLFPFVVENGAFYVKLANREPQSKLPCVYAQVRSEYLLQAGPAGAEEELRRWLSKVVQIDGREVVSRLDPALDFVTDAVMDAWSRRAWVTKIRQRSNFSDGEHFTGWKIGTHKNPISLRLYDKTHELSGSAAKPRLFEAWERGGHVPWDSVWRVEGQFRREALRALGLDTLPDAVCALQGLWRQLTHEVVRLCVENPTDATRGRWLEHPLWTAISSVDWKSTVREVEPSARPSAAPSNDYFVRQVKSLVTSKMARDGETSAHQALLNVWEIVVDSLFADSDFTGLSPEEALKGIVANKRRKFFAGRGTPAPPPPEVEAAARAYREGSQGS
jgi:hypothetical protein